MNKIQEALERIIYDLNSWCETWTPTSYTDPRISLTMIADRAKVVLESNDKMEELDPSHIIKDGDFLYYRGEKYEKVKQPPRMYLENEGEFVIVTYNHKIYYRTETPATFVWWVVNYNSDNQRRLEVVSDLETQRLLEGIYFNDVKRGQYDD